jgi:hypothetical protein
MGAVVTFPRNETALADARAVLRRETASPEELRAACNTLLLLGSPTDVELARIVLAFQRHALLQDANPPRRVYLSDALLVAGFFAALWLMLAVTQS